MSRIETSVLNDLEPRQCNDWPSRRIVTQNCKDKEQEKNRLVALGQLTAGAVHDIKNFCQEAKGLEFLALRRMNDRDYSKVTEHLVSIANSVDEIVALCDSMLEFGSSKIRIVDPIFLDHAVTMALMMATVTLSGVNHETFYRYEGVKVNISAFQLQQIMLNLIRNARYALSDPVSSKIREGGKITIQIHPMVRGFKEEMLECSEHSQYVGISVDDNGDGMSEDVLLQIAKPFFTTKPVEKGTGLGLFMSAHIADLHGGSLIVRTKIDVGTRVTLCLPIAV
ncbi:MAG: HAMP domain-containing histidine kinase [Candidatus Pacebacteria bacterium]|nr:HAMP domain-containing histidine kinase [Candidatus Paceibacterota bacterium]MCF7857567.1 HAMP domain-containing histidine kinase [Candidatus Paceibacterota bacterium]